MKEQITKILSGVTYPNFTKDIVSYGFLKEVIENNGIYEVKISIPSSDKAIAKALFDKIDNELSKQNIQAKILISQPESTDNHKKVEPKNLAPNIKKFIMVSSGKGGVGKSSASVNLAIALAMQGKKVGLLDTDIYGPNVPRMMGLVNQKPELTPDGKKLLPLNAFGVSVMSVGLLYKEGESLIWRGPMLMRAITQMFSDVEWGELDILVLDMPPGTGDAQLTIAQNISLNCGVTITTPQVVSLDDSARSLDMLNKLSIPIAGIIENMSSFICPDCKSEHDIFGSDSTKNLANKYNTNIIAKIPLDPSIAKAGDEGKPIVYFAPESKGAKEYIKAAINILDFIK